MTRAVRDGHLVIDHANAARRTRLVREPADSWRCLDRYYAGELLRVVRDGSGSGQRGRISHLDLITHVLTRTPAADP